MNNLFKSSEHFSLQYINRMYDGLPVWETCQISGRKITESSGLAGENTPELFMSACYLVSPEGRIPKPGDRILHNGTCFDVSRVETKKDLRGNTLAYRCLCGKI